MAIKRQGIVARPGTHKDEVITAKELQRAIQYQNRIPLIVGPHPVGGYSSPSDWIGTVSTRWNETANRVDGDFWFFDEEWNRVPEEVRRKILNKKEVNLSAGYQVGKVEDGIQIGRKWDHLALNVTSPMFEDVGVNVRMESEFPENFRVEETPVIPGDEPKEEKPAAMPTAEQIQDIVDKAVTAALEAQKPVEVESPKEEEPVEEAPQEEEVVEARPDPVPKEVLPASAPAPKSKDGPEVLDDGWWKLS